MANKIKFPSSFILADAVIFIMKNRGQMTTTEMNDAVADYLNLPQELLEVENENCSGSEFGYRMRWVRTSLKHKNVLSNPKRGVWAYNPEP